MTGISGSHQSNSKSRASGLEHQVQNLTLSFLRAGRRQIAQYFLFLVFQTVNGVAGPFMNCRERDFRVKTHEGFGSKSNAK